ncbi:carbohydrate porin [Sphingomonas sp. WKB10]|nr:carbohydrate porin [Sphingomonas sp. WKB10]
MDKIFAICRAMRWGAGIIAMSVGCVDAAIAQEASSAWSLSAEYTADLAGVASGGLERGVRYLDNIDVIAEADLDALIGWHGGKAHAALLNNMGGKPNDLAGSIQGINNIEVSQGRFKLYEAWVEQALAPGWSLRAGLYDVNSEFYQNDAAGLLISPMFGVGSELAATGVNGPAIFLDRTRRPAAGRGRQDLWRIRRDQRARRHDRRRTWHRLHRPRRRAGDRRSGLDGQRPRRRRRMDLHAHPADDHSAGNLARARFSRIPRRLSDRRAPARRQADAPRQLEGFLRLGLSEGKTTPFRGGWQGGLLLKQPFASRPDSAVSIGAGSGVLSNSYRSANPPELPALGRAETIIEATYTDTLIKGVSVQPDIQYVINPSADRTIRNALVLGLRLTLGWSAH